MTSFMRLNYLSVYGMNQIESGGMLKEKESKNTAAAKGEKKDLPEYVSPKISLYTNEDILDQIGPAQAGVGPTPP